MKDGNYITMSGILPPNDSLFNFILVSSYDPKGNINWTKRIYIPGKTIQPGHNNIFQAYNDSLYMTFSLYGENDKRAITTLSKSGDKGITRILNNITKDENDLPNHFISDHPDSTFLHAVSFNDTLDNIYITRYTEDFKTSSTAEIKTSTNDNKLINAHIYGFKVNADSTSMIIGRSNIKGQTNTSGLFTFLDKNLNSKFSRAYNRSGTAPKSSVRFTQMASFDKGYILGGRFINNDQIDSLDNNYEGLIVLRVDTIGRIVWSKMLDAKFKDNALTGLSANEDGEITISGTLTDTSKLKVFILKMDEDGKQEYFNTYDKSEAVLSELGTIFEDKNGGHMHMFSDQEKKSRVNLLKVDKDGKSGCEIKREDEVMKNLFLISTSLKSTRKDQILITKNNISNFEVFDKFNVPVLALPIKTFCPNEKISFLLDAKLKDAVAYKWSDGSTKDTLRVFDTKEYSVTVTMDGEYCFMLCDTAKLDRSNVPMVSLVPGDRVCEGKPFIINALVQEGRPGFTFNWSSGVSGNGPSVSASVLGNYSVTVTDQCMDSATDAITITKDIYFGPPTGIILGPNPNSVCRNGNFDLIATGLGGGGGPYTFKWNTGETTSTITKTSLGVYNVTVTDKCGLTGTAIIEVKADIYLGPPSGNIIGPNPNSICRNGEFNLIAVGSSGGGEPYTFKWNTGETSSSITNIALGIYNVTVTDKCGLTGSANIEVKNDIYLGPPTGNIIGPELKSVCKNKDFELDAFGSSGGGGPYTFKWNTGETSASITKTALGVYSITVTDKCGLTGTANYTVNQDIYFVPKPTIIPPIQNSICKGNPFDLTIAMEDETKKYIFKWSSGEDTRIITKTELGKYSVVVTDSCGQTGSAEINIKDDIYFSSVSDPMCIGWPNIFLPDTTSTGGPNPTPNPNNELNAFFGPVIICDSTSFTSIADYELMVFDRWGKVVFASNKFVDKWDGTKDKNKEQKYPPDVYVWYARYTYDGCFIERKGDVTLFR